MCPEGRIGGGPVQKVHTGIYSNCIHTSYSPDTRVSGNRVFLHTLLLSYCLMRLSLSGMLLCTLERRAHDCGSGRILARLKLKMR